MAFIDELTYTQLNYSSLNGKGIINKKNFSINDFYVQLWFMDNSSITINNVNNFNLVLNVYSTGTL